MVKGEFLCASIPVQFVDIAVIGIIMFGRKEFEAGREIFMNRLEKARCLDNFVGFDYNAHIVVISLHSGIFAVHSSKNKSVEEQTSIPETNVA